jgi:hypothetical protein
LLIWEVDFWPLGLQVIMMLFSWTEYHKQAQNSETSFILILVRVITRRRFQNAWLVHWRWLLLISVRVSSLLYHQRWWNSRIPFWWRSSCTLLPLTMIMKRSRSKRWWCKTKPKKYLSSLIRLWLERMLYKILRHSYSLARTSFQSDLICSWLRTQLQR